MKLTSILLFIMTSYTFAQSNVLQCLEESASCSLKSSHSKNNELNSIDTLSYHVLSQRVGINLNHVYLALVGPGEDIQSWGGHAILIFTEDKDDITRGLAYHYNFIESEDKNKQGSFAVIEETSTQALENYRSQNRVTNIYKININSSEVKRLALRVNEDKRYRDKNTLNDYDTMKNNCLTNIVKNINKSIHEQKKKIPSIWVPNGRSISTKLFSNLSLSSNTPYTLGPILERSDLFTFKRTYKSKIQIEVIEKIELVKPLKYLTSICEWNEDIMNQFEKLILNERISKSQKPINYLYNKTLDCIQNNQAIKRKAIRKFNYFIMLYSGVEFDYDSTYPFK